MGQFGVDKQGIWREWSNSYYTVIERPSRDCLMVVNNDQSARRDWREFQAIKNQLFGKSAEAVELYPAESRVKDPSNAFFLWRLSSKAAKKIGLKGPRVVSSPRKAIAPQREFIEQAMNTK